MCGMRKQQAVSPNAMCVICLFVILKYIKRLNFILQAIIKYHIGLQHNS